MTPSTCEQDPDSHIPLIDTHNPFPCLFLSRGTGVPAAFLPSLQRLLRPHKRGKLRLRGENHKQRSANTGDADRTAHLSMSSRVLGDTKDW